MTTPNSPPRSSVAQAIALLSHYGFDTKPYTAAERVGHWLDDYEASWIRFAIIEALYQGRYKSISVEHILSMWQRRGQPSHHFNGDFERIICRKLPAWFQSNGVPLILAEDDASEEEDAAPAPPRDTPVAAPATKLPDAQRGRRELQRRRLRVLGITRWRGIARRGTTTYDGALLKRLKAIALILPIQLQADLDAETAAQETTIIEPSPKRAIAPPETGSSPSELFATAGATHTDEPTSTPRETDVVTLDVDSVPMASEPFSETALVDTPTVELPRTEPLPPLARSGIRTFMPSLRISPFFIRLKAVRAATLRLPESAVEPTAVALPPLANPATVKPTLEPTPAANASGSRAEPTEPSSVTPPSPTSQVSSVQPPPMDEMMPFGGTNLGGEDITLDELAVLRTQ